MPILLRPLHRSVAQKGPKLWGGGGNLEPVVTNEEEVVRTLPQPVKIFPSGDVPAKDVPEDFGRDVGGYVQ